MTGTHLMPQVFDLTTEEAEAALRASGLDFDVVLAQSTAVPEGDLINVSPSPGTPVDEGTRIVLFVSAGPPIVGGDNA
jgi:serine/threonine-protein kinase